MEEEAEVTTNEEIEATTEKEVEVTVNYIRGENKESTAAVIKGRVKTIGELRPLIQVFHRVRVKAQVLQDDYTIIRDDNTRLDSLTGFDGEAIRITLYRKIKPQEVTIQIEFDGNPLRDMELTVSSQMLVSGLKELIDEIDGISPHRQRLTVGMANELNNSDYLDEYITAEPIILRLHEISRKPDDTIWIGFELAYGPIQKLSMEKNDTIFNLKGEVRRAEWVEGDFYVSLIGEEETAKILVGPMTLDESGIIDGSIVLVEEDG